MNYNHKKMDKIGKLLVDGLLLVLLWAILAVPASTFSLLKVNTGNVNVLSGQDARPQPRISPQDETKSYRDTPDHRPQTDNTGDYVRIYRNN